jgi:toxin CcdB
MSTADMAGVSLNTCGEKVLSLESKRNEIIDALDFLVNGF